MTKSNHFAKIVVKWILEKYEKEDIYNKIGEQIHEYLEDGWEEEFESEAEAYDEQGRGEAESDIITELLTEPGLFGNPKTRPGTSSRTRSGWP